MSDLTGEWAYRVQHVDDIVTYVDPHEYLCKTKYPSNGPFDLIDTQDEQERIDYGERMKDLISDAHTALDKLIMELLQAEGLIHVRLRSIGNTSRDYGSLSWYSMAIFCASALCDDKVTMSFRTKREAMTFLLELMTRIIQKLPEDQRPRSWDALALWHDGGVEFWREEDHVEYRLTALALRLLDDERWADVRDSDDGQFDCYGHASVPASGDKAEELLLGSDGRCVCCGRSRHEMGHFVQLNRYARLCDRCVDAIAEVFARDEDAIVAHRLKSLTAKTREAMERCFRGEEPRC